MNLTVDVRVGVILNINLVSSKEGIPDVCRPIARRYHNFVSIKVSPRGL